MGNYYRKTKSLFKLHVLQADPINLDEKERRHNNPYKYILHVFSVFCRYAHVVQLQLKKEREVKKLLKLLNLYLNKIVMGKFQ